MRVILFLRSNITKTSFSVHSLVFFDVPVFIIRNSSETGSFVSDKACLCTCQRNQCHLWNSISSRLQRLFTALCKKIKEKIANLRRTHTNHNLLLNRTRTKTNTLGEPYPLNLATVVAETGAKEMSVPFAAPSPLKL